MLSKDFLITISYQYFKISHIFVVRITTIILGIIALIVSMKNKLILEAIWFVKNFWSPVILVPLIAGFIGLNNRKVSFIHGFIGGVIGVMAGGIAYKKVGLESLMIGVVCNAIGFFGVKLIWSKLKKCIQIIAEYNLERTISKIKQYKIATKNQKRDRFFLLLSILLNVPMLIYSIYSSSIANICINVALQIMLLISYTYNYVKLYKAINFSSYIFLTYFSFYHFSFQPTWLLSIVLIIYVLFLIRESTIEFFIYFALLIFVNIIISLFQYERFHIVAPQYLGLYITSCCLFYLAAAIYWNIRELKEAIFLMQASLHDACSAINSNKNNVFLLREDNNKKKKILEIADQILISLGKSQNICKFPLMLSKIGNNTFLKEEINLKRIINDSIAYYSKVNQEDIKISVDLINVNTRIVANHELLCRVIGIILNNAVDAFDKILENKIIITSQVRENKLELVIEDNGRGIKKDDITCIFNYGMSTKKDGFGIGLSFVKFALDKMDIAIRCKSAYRKGTTFVLIFNL
jgi:signal transduction histidine kinase